MVQYGANRTETSVLKIFEVTITMPEIVCSATARESLVIRGDGGEMILTKPIFTSLSVISAVTLEMDGFPLGLVQDRLLPRRSQWESTTLSGQSKIDDSSKWIKRSVGNNTARTTFK